MILSIQQPEFFPWLGFMDKLLQVDKVVFLDNVQFKKRYFENRNRIRVPDGWTWLRTPVKTKNKFTQNIMDVEVDDSQQWQDRMIATLQRNYKKAPYWDDLGDELCGLIKRPYGRLVDLNMGVILLLMKKLGIVHEWQLASDLSTERSGSDLILEICKKIGCSTYLSGRDGARYLKEDGFESCGIKVVYQQFEHPVYTQFHGGFESGMSIIDLYFNHGSDSVDIIRGA